MFDRQDVVSGGLIAAVGLTFAAGARLELPLGSAGRMGPGYFPLLLGGILSALGLLIMARAYGRSSPALPAFSWRGFVLIPAAVLCFSMLVHRLGLVPALMAATFITAYSSRTVTFGKAALLAAGLTLFCVITSKWGLKITPPLFGSS